ncbi:YncE family protein [Streptomyces sp. NPDC059893]|uniref:YncE family protein n=1 Tax=Streptomyces sp. NPDC059893 TaxID=3346990 RepID=UPI00365616FB
MTARARGVLGAMAVVVLAAGCTATGTADSTASSPPAATVTPSAPAPARTAQGTLLVADFGSDTVTFVDPQRGPLASVKVGTAPYGLAVGEDGRAWVATGEYRGGGMGIALAPDGKHVYVGVNVPDEKGMLEVVDTATRKVTDTVPVGRRPFDVDVSRDGGEVYATGHDSFDVTAVRADTLTARRFEVAPYGTEGGLGSWLKPHYAAVRDDGKLLLPFEGEKLAVLDPRTGKVAVEPMTADTHQHGARLTPDGTLLAVGTGPIGAGDDDASLTIRTADGKERVVPLDGPHEDVAASRDGRTAYVTGGFTRDGFWDGITVVDLRSGDTHRLPAGHRPLGIAVL